MRCAIISGSFYLCLDDWLQTQQTYTLFNRTGVTWFFPPPRLIFNSKKKKVSRDRFSRVDRLFTRFLCYFFSRRSRADVIAHVVYGFGGLCRTRKRNRDDHVIYNPNKKWHFFRHNYFLGQPSFSAKKSLTTYFRLPCLIVTIVRSKI